NCCRADMQYACSIANATGVQGHIDDLLLDLRRLTGVGILQEKRRSMAQATLPAPVALLAFKGRATSHNINTLAVGTIQHLGDHGTPYKIGSTPPATEDTRSTDLKHLPIFQPYGTIGDKYELELSEDPI